jgi:hypothetical protein
MRTRMYSCQASAEHFQQCAEFLLLRNRGFGALAVTVLPVPLARRAAATACAAVHRQCAAACRRNTAAREGTGDVFERLLKTIAKEKAKMAKQEAAQAPRLDVSHGEDADGEAAN